MGKTLGTQARVRNSPGKRAIGVRAIEVSMYIHVYIERYNKSTMPENAEKYLSPHRGIRTHDLDNTAEHCTIRHFYQLRYLDNLKKGGSNNTDIGIG